MEAIVIELELPYPPSANHYYRRVGHRTLISRGGREYRRTVAAILAAAAIRPIPGRLAVQVQFYPPDRRKRDCDNAGKSLCDSLEHGGAFHDDSQIVWFLIEKAEVVPSGKALVRIAEFPCGKLSIQKFPPWSLN